MPWCGKQKAPDEGHLSSNAKLRHFLKSHKITESASAATIIFLRERARVCGVDVWSVWHGLSQILVALLFHSLTRMRNRSRRTSCSSLLFQEAQFREKERKKEHREIHRQRDRGSESERPLCILTRPMKREGPSGLWSAFCSKLIEGNPIFINMPNCLLYRRSFPQCKQKQWRGIGMFVGFSRCGQTCVFGANGL